MAVKRSSIRLDTDLADEAVKILAAKSRTEAVDVALREIVALKRFKKLRRSKQVSCPSTVTRSSAFASLVSPHFSQTPLGKRWSGSEISIRNE